MVGSVVSVLVASKSTSIELKSLLLSSLYTSSSSDCYQMIGNRHARESERRQANNTEISIKVWLLDSHWYLSSSNALHQYEALYRIMLLKLSKLAYRHALADDTISFYPLFYSRNSFFLSPWTSNHEVWPSNLPPKWSVVSIGTSFQMFESQRKLDSDPEMSSSSFLSNLLICSQFTQMEPFASPSYTLLEMIRIVSSMTLDLHFMPFQALRMRVRYSSLNSLSLFLSPVYESSSERWSPVQSIEKILLSVLSMLAEPNVESGANIDACVSQSSR